jgi:mono/diheme cytochrome c family protein
VGSHPEAVVTTIAYGRIGVMPAWQDALGEPASTRSRTTSDQVSGRQAGRLAAAGQEKFQMFCAACHGADAKGMQALGGPNLTDDYWVYGGSRDVIRQTVANGRQNQMPAHLDLLGEQKVKLLAAYVLGLGAAGPRPRRRGRTCRGERWSGRWRRSRAGVPVRTTRGAVPDDGPAFRPLEPRATERRDRALAELPGRRPWRRCSSSPCSTRR